MYVYDGYNDVYNGISFAAHMKLTQHLVNYKR